MLLRYAFYCFTLLVIGFVIYTAHIIGNAMIQPGNIEAKYNAIVVLTGGSNRIPQGIELLKAGVGQKLFITSVHENYKKSSVTTNGKYHEDIILDTNAIDTYGNAVNAQKWMVENNYRSALVVTSNYHLPRAMIHFYRVMPAVEFDGYPVDSILNNTEKWWLSYQNWRLLIRSYIKFVVTVPLGIVPFIEKTGGISLPSHS